MSNNNKCQTLEQLKTAIEAEFERMRVEKKIADNKVAELEAELAAMKTHINELEWKLKRTARSPKCCVDCIPT